MSIEVKDSIKSRVIKFDMIQWKDLQFIQNEDFKQWIDGGDQKLINSLLKYQFVDPFKVWENEGVIYLNGHLAVNDFER